MTITVVEKVLRQDIERLSMDVDRLTVERDHQYALNAELAREALVAAASFKTQWTATRNW